MTGKALLLIAGIPATGKSHFGQWLSREHGYVHVDVEKACRLEILGLRATWDACFQSGDASPFVADLRALGSPVAVDWGFPPDLLHIVRALKREGVGVWWFDGDRARAREEFVKRGTVPVANFDAQMPRIEFRWAEIRDAFGLNRIDVLASSGQRMSPEEIWGILRPGR
jgi:hypothetical protein